MSSAIATERFSDRKLKMSDDGKWTATRCWDVINYVSELDAIASTGVALDSSHPRCAGLICTSVEQVEDKLTLGKVQADYKISSGQLMGNANPLLNPPTITWKKGKVSINVDTDINGNPILNSATDAFKSAFPRNFAVKFLTITRYEPYFDQAAGDLYTDTCNSGPVTFQGVTYTAGQMYCHGICPVEAYALNSPYVKIGYDFEIRSWNWPGLTAKQKRYPFQLRLLDQGLRGLVATGQLGDFFLKAGGKITRDVLLNGSGVPIDTTITVGDKRGTPASNTVPSNVLVDSMTNATALIYGLYAEQNFAAMGIAG